MDNTRYGRVRALFAASLAVSIGALGVAALVGGNATVWTRGVIVTVIAALLLVLAKRAMGGSRGAYRRMRFTTTVAPVATAVVIALPHDGFPGWMKAEQAVFGILLAAAAVVVGRRSVRDAYRKAVGEPAR